MTEAWDERGGGTSPVFGDTYWRRTAEPLAFLTGFTDRFDERNYKELVDNLPTLCWFANADGYITWYNRRWHEYCGTTPDQMEGWGWQSVHDPAALPDVMTRWTGSIASGEPFEMVFPLRGADGVFRPFLTRIVPLRDEAGAVRRWIGNNIDISRQAAIESELRRSQDDLRAAHRRLAEREAFLSSVLASSTDCIKVLDLDGRVDFISDGGQRVLEISDFNQVKGCPWPEFLKDDGPLLARDALDQARQGRSTCFVTPADTFAGTPKSWSVSVSPILGTDGKADRILSVSRDVTELDEARQQQRLLNAELAHRIKNTMSVVQAIAYQTLGKVADAAALKAFGDRLAALGASHDLLTAQNWSGTQLADLAERALSIFGANRFTISGPAIEIGPRATLSLSLMLHELATNAVKYGALSTPAGMVTFGWTIEGETIAVRWEERGGPPAVEPTRRGFGSRIIRMGLIGSGGVDLRYTAEGLTLEAVAPLCQVQEA